MKKLISLWDQATRIGTLSLLVYAILSFATNIILPFLVVPSYKPQDPEDDEPVQVPITPTTPIAVRTPGTPWGERPTHQPHPNWSAT